MITSSIARNFFLLTLAFNSLSCPAESTYEKTNFSESRYQIESICNDPLHKTQQCKIYAVGEFGSQLVLSFPFPPASISYKNSIFVITFPCGTDCSATYFYRHGTRVGGPLPLVVAYDCEREVALSVVAQKLKMFKFFSSGNKSKPIGEVKLILSDGSSLPLSLISAEVDANFFTVRYTNKKGTESVTKVEVPAK